MAHWSNEAWVTRAVSNETVANALILAASIRETATTRKVVVISSKNVSVENRYVLEKTFDKVFFLEELNLSDKPHFNEALALAYTFALIPFHRCVYVSPNSMFLKNADNLFESSYSFQSKINRHDGSLNLTTFMLVPNKDVWMHIRENVLMDLQDISERYLSTWLKNQNAVLNLGIIQDDIIADFSTSNRKLLSNQIHPAIIHFMENTSKTLSLYEQLKLINVADIRLHEQLILEMWFQLHEKMVQFRSTSTQSILQTFGTTWQNQTKEPIAIVGMSCRYPAANNLEEFWNLLYKGEEGISLPPKIRLSKEYNTATIQKETTTKAGFLSVPVDKFDSAFFGVSPKDAVYIDPQARLLHEVMWEALEDAGIDPLGLYGSHTGIFTGSWTNEYRDFVQDSAEKDFFRTYLGNSMGAVAARLSFVLGLTGPSIATESGCSSAIVALDLAIKSLRAGETNLALAGGVNLLLQPIESSMMEVVISSDGRCKTFDAKADGFGRAEGCGVLVLKRLSDALRDRDHIWAMVRGSAISQEGMSRSLGTPTEHCEALAMQLALKDANVLPEQVSFVEAHGTGTKVGDPMEISAISKAYYTAKRKTPLVIGSVKTNVGHTESCSGITGVMKAVLGLQHELIPKHRNLNTLNPEIVLDSIPAIIPMENMPWPKVPGQPRICGVSSFGLTGTDGHVIIEEAPTNEPPKFNLGLQRPTHLMTISGKTSEALDELLCQYENRFSELIMKQDKNFANLVYSANVGRASFNHRAFLVATDYQDALKILQTKSFLRNETKDGINSKLCFLFTGQGSQYSGMAKLLYDSSPVFRVNFDICSRTLKDTYNFSIDHVLWELDSSSKELGRTLYSQTSIFCVEYCLLKLWESWGIKPDYVLGHSLGEICAAVAAEVLSFEDALKLVAERSRLIDNLPRGSMLVIKASKPEVEKLMKAAEIDLDFAAFNSPEQTVVAGNTKTVEGFLAYLKGQNTKAIILDATHAFHSRHMDPMLESYMIVAQSIKYKPGNPNIKYISGMEGRIIDDSSELGAEYWVRHTREKVSFIEACSELSKFLCQNFLEVGPQPILSTFVMQNLENASLNCLASLRRTTDDWETILTSLGKLYLLGYQVDWKGFDSHYVRKKVPLPFHPFHRKHYWVEQNINEKSLIHPLIGYQMNNASSLNIFQNDLTLSSVSFLKDHCIGNRVLLAGACFTEMCLFAGYSVSHNLSEICDIGHAISLENLEIHAPLELNDEAKCRLQTIVDLPEQHIAGNEKHGYQVKIYHKSKDSDSGKWLLHASSTFIPVASSKTSLALWDSNRIPEIISNSQATSPDHVYKRWNEQGMRFGDKFRMLRKWWYVRQPNLKRRPGDEVVAEMELPVDWNKYVLHPLILDAALQACALTRFNHEEVRLNVPVRIKELILISRLSSESLINVSSIYLQAWNDDADKSYIFVATSNWTPIALISDVELIETNVRTIESVLEQQVSSIPDAWEETWKAIPSPSNTLILGTVEARMQRWILFGDSNNLEILSIVANMLYSSGSRVEIIWKENRIPNKEDVEMNMKKGIEHKSLNIDSKMDMETIFCDRQIDGVVYAWGLCPREIDQSRIALPFLNLAKTLSEMLKSPQLLVVTMGVQAVSEDSAYLDPSLATLWGMVKSLKNETDMTVSVLDLEADAESGLQAEKILHELATLKEPQEQQRLQVAYRGNVRYEPRLCKAILPSSKDMLKLPPSTDIYQLRLPKSRMIQDLDFELIEEESVESNEIEIKVNAYALNFRDIFAIIKPNKEFENLNAVGLDVAGTVTKTGPKSSWKVGDEVFGVNLNGGQLRSYLNINSEAVLRIPDTMTFEEAVTLPTVFQTAYHCLIIVAKMKKGDKVLIHTGSGGVGLAAIQLAKNVGAEIITTAGNPRKRAYLESLGIQHVFHSRNTSYEQDIMRATNGHGVDIVLNSITGPGIKEATLRATAKNGRFVEMSKLSVWKPEEVQELRPDVSYSIVDLSVIDQHSSYRIISKMSKYLAIGKLKALPYTRFDALCIRQALQYFQKAKHIGKVVITMPEVSTHQGQYKTEVRLFNSKSTYLITGGLGGIGFQVCQWMLQLGATDIVLTGRSSPTQEIANKIAKLNNTPFFNVIVKLGDIGNYEHCKKMIADINAGMKPLRGIMHCAGVIKDSMYTNQNWDNFEATYNPKIKGTWNLHHLTKNCPLEYFVVYSSMAALVGTPYQPNHCSANCFEDAFIHYRHSMGLPGTSINWGQWAQVGCAKDISLSGLVPISVQRMLNGMEMTLRAQKRQVCLSELDSFTNFTMLCPSFKNYLEERLWKQQSEIGHAKQGAMKSDQFWKEMDKVHTKVEKCLVLSARMSAILKQSLRLDNEVAVTANLQELGVDSLMMIEFKNSIQSVLGSRMTITTNMVKNFDTIQSLANAVVDSLIEKSEQTEMACKVSLTKEEMLNMLLAESKLDDNIKVLPDAIAPVKPSEIKSVLVTGATGQVAPYIIAKLSEMHIDKIWCLIVGDKDVTKKLTNKLDMLGIANQIDLKKIECVAGNVAQENLGLESEVYGKLSFSVDAVIHCAAKTHPTEHINLSLDNFGGSLRSVNICGTKNVLKFASTGKVKHVLYPSTLTLETISKHKENQLVDVWPETQALEIIMDSKFGAFQATKSICEMLLKQAYHRGIPCKVFRLPWISGETNMARPETVLSSLNILRFIIFLKVGAMPNVNIPANVLPVDICADACLNIFLSDEAQNQVYNVGHIQQEMEKEFVNLAKNDFGKTLGVLERTEFENKIKEEAKQNKNVLKRLLSNQNIDFGDIVNFVVGNESYPETCFRKRKVTKAFKNYGKDFPSTMEIIRRDLCYMKEAGLLEMFGI